MNRHTVCFVTLLGAAQLTLMSSQAMDYYSNNKSPLTAYDIGGHLDQTAVLRCQLLTGRHNRGWYVITWHRVEHDGTALPLVHLPVRQKVPEWNKQIPPTFQPRVQSVITIQPGHVEFNLQINNLTCSDEGEYRCSAVTPEGEIMSNAELRVYASPRTPRITFEYLPSKQPGEITVECQADVGLPPKMLVWYSKPPGAHYFTLLDLQPDEIQETDGCRTRSRRSLDVTVSSETRGTQYRCGYPGYIEKEGMYDELVVEFDRPGLEEVREGPKTGASCRDGLCEDNPAESVDGTNNKASSFPGYKLHILSLCILASVILCISL